MDACDRCGKRAELFHNDSVGLALCEDCDRKQDADDEANCCGKGGYVVFAMDTYYPVGGWSDFYDRFPTEDEARASARQSTAVHDWWQIVNVVTGQIIDSGGKHESS